MTLKLCKICKTEAIVYKDKEKTKELFCIKCLRWFKY